MKKIFRISILILIIFSLSACKSIEKKYDALKNRKNFEYTKNQVLLLSLSQKKDIEEVYSPDIWNVMLKENTTYKTIFLNDMKEFFKELEILNILAAEKGTFLNAEELEKISSQAKKFYDMNIKENQIFEDMSYEELQEIYEKYSLANKVKKELSSQNIGEISKSEARVIQVKKIVLNDEQIAREVFNKINEENSDFDKILLAESIDVEDIIRLAKGELDKEAEDKVFALEEGMVSDIIEMGSKYYIFKCINAYDEEATNQQKEYIKEKRIHEYVFERYKEISEKYHMSSGENIWEDVYTQIDRDYNGKSFFIDYEEIGIDGGL